MNLLTTTDRQQFALCGSTQRERADCAVRALSTVLSIPYYEAHRIAEDGGRKAGCRASIVKVANSARRHYRLEKMRGSRRTLRRFCREHPVGRFLVRKSGHAFALIDGIVFDMVEQSPDCIITHAWRVA